MVSKQWLNSKGEELWLINNRPAILYTFLVNRMNHEWKHLSLLEIVKKKLTRQSLESAKTKIFRHVIKKSALHDFCKMSKHYETQR